MILIGSRAIKYHIPDYPLREDADWDIMVQHPEMGVYSDGENVETHSWLSPVFGYCDHQNYVDFHNQTLYVPSLKGLAVLKRSHLWRDLCFDKHITQYHRWMKPAVGKFSEVDLERLETLTKWHKKKFPQKNPDLTKTNKDFFDGAVDKVYDHDWLHSLVAYRDRPMFEYLKREGEEDKAWCTKDLWEELPHIDKLRCVAEECYVIACERFLIPRKYDYPEKLAYLHALRKVCTTLCSGWFRDFAIDNYPNIVDLFDTNRVNLIKEKTL